jgi:hypothetical protein
MAASSCSTLHAWRRDVSGYLPIENYGMIGNMRTCALVSMNGSVGKSPGAFLTVRMLLTSN